MAVDKKALPDRRLWLAVWFPDITLSLAHTKWTLSLLVHQLSSGQTHAGVLEPMREFRSISDISDTTRVIEYPSREYSRVAE